MVKSAYRVALDGFAQPYGDVAVGGWRNTPYVVIQNVGAYLDVPRFLDTDHRVENAQDAEAYLARLESYPVQLEGEFARLKEAAGKGLIAPAFLIDKAVGQMTMSVKNAREGGGLVESIERRTKDIPGDWAARARAITQQKIAPALERQLAELQAQRTRATMDAGMWARPNGPEFYQWALRASTTTRMTPDEIHQMGLDQVAELHGRMDVILKSLGYTKGSVGARMTALSDDPRYKFAEGDPGRAEIMAFIQERLKIIRAQLPRAFRTLVRGNLEVKRLPPEEEPGAPGAYGGAGSIDGSIPGKFWINLRTTDLHRKYDLPDLAHHEAIPGHVWQGEYSNQLPLIRTMLAFNAYSEGWALYAEQLADELGVYDGFEVGRLGYLQSLAFRAMPAGRRHRHPPQALDPRTRRSLLRRDERLEAGGSRERSRPLLQLGRPGLRLQDRPYRDRPAAQPCPEGAWCPVMTCAISTTRWSKAATSRSTCSPRMSTNISRRPAERNDVIAPQIVSNAK